MTEWDKEPNTPYISSIWYNASNELTQKPNTDFELRQIGLAFVVSSIFLLAVLYEQNLKTAYDLGNDFHRDGSDPGCFTCTPVQAFHLVRPYHTCHG